MVVILDLQLRLQSGVRRVSETNRTRKFSRNLTGEARRDIWDDEVWQLCESGLDVFTCAFCVSIKSIIRHITGSASGRNRSGDPFSSVRILVCQSKEFTGIAIGIEGDGLNRVVRNSGIIRGIGIVDEILNFYLKIEEKFYIA